VTKPIVLVPEKIAASGGGPSISLGTGGSRLTVSRRPVLEMPIAAAAADPATDTFSPGAEFEPVSPLDVPAFLRRKQQSKQQEDDDNLPLG
jgi:hypothetical protein